MFIFIMPSDNTTDVAHLEEGERDLVSQDTFSSFPEEFHTHLKKIK